MDEEKKKLGIVTAQDRQPSVSIVCRICYDNDKEEDLIAPCKCKGSVAYVHKSCLETWLGESNSTKCELCHQIFKTERTLKYTSTRSVWHWCRTSQGGFTRGVRSDVLACTLITPLAIVITYICLFSAEYYSQKKFVQVPAARWTSVSLLVMITIMLIGYYLWVYSVIRLHARVWYNWWQRSCDVRYLSDGPRDVSPTCHLTSVTSENQEELDSQHDSNVQMNMIDVSSTNLPIIITQGSNFSIVNSGEDIV